MKILLTFLASTVVAVAAPNVVIIMVDDMGYSDLGCYGGEIDTPNIDRLADNGLRFTQFYNCGRCCPTRASLLTGNYPHRAGIGFMTAQDFQKPGYRGTLDHDSVTIAEALKPAGYKSYIAGKWHVCREFSPTGTKKNWPLQRGFDRFYGTLIAAGSQWDPLTLTEGNEPAKLPDGAHYTDVIADMAVTYIDEHEGDKPFFLYVAHTAPHWPLHARDDVLEKYRGRFSKGWDQLRSERLKKLRKLGILPDDTKLSARDPQVSAWDSTPDQAWQQTRFEAYAALLDQADQATGRVVDALKRKGVLDDTLIFFLSDNGGDSLEHPDGTIGSTGKPWAYMRYVPLFTPEGKPVLAGDIPGWKLGPPNTYGGYGTPWANLSNTPFRRFKKDPYEGGITTPLIVHWPKGLSEKGALRHKPAHVIDLLPTILDAADLEHPTQYNDHKIIPADGRSLIPSLAKDTATHKTLFWEHHGNRAVRDGDWKLAALHDQPWELYNLATDRTETTNVAKQHPDRVTRLIALYDAWAARSDVIARDQLDIPEIPPGDNPLVRSPEEMKTYLETVNPLLKKEGFKTFDQP